jgi:hypothetical protein
VSDILKDDKLQVICNVCPELLIMTNGWAFSALLVHLIRSLGTGGSDELIYILTSRTSMRLGSLASSAQFLPMSTFLVLQMCCMVLPSWCISMSREELRLEFLCCYCWIVESVNHGHHLCTFRSEKSLLSCSVRLTGAMAVGEKSCSDRSYISV